MSNFFVISDSHFSHELMIKIRGFASAKDMDDLLVTNWNKVVRPPDHVYHLGDVAMKKQFLNIVRKLNGHKRLVMGNHDIFEVKDYMNAGFQKVMGMRIIEGFILTHIPIHPHSLGRFHRNIHGHLHAQAVVTEDNNPDPRYFSVCCERIDYTPISLEEIKAKVKTNEHR